MKKTSMWIKIILLILISCVILIGIAVIAINSYVKNISSTHIITPASATAVSDIDCILVLGCGVREDGTPSHMLEDRLKRGIELYHSGVSEKLLMSGDHGQEDYNEVAVMKQYAVDHAVPSYNVFMDHAGFSTYESIYRAKEIFGAKKILIVSQEYHLYRALYIANAFGLDAYGVAADYRSYAGQTARDAREILARVKDVATSAFKPEPTFLGDVIPVSGNGDITND